MAKLLPETSGTLLKYEEETSEPRTWKGGGGNLWLCLPPSSQGFFNLCLKTKAPGHLLAPQRSDGCEKSRQGLCYQAIRAQLQPLSPGLQHTAVGSGATLPFCSLIVLIVPRQEKAQPTARCQQQHLVPKQQPWETRSLQVKDADL